MSTPPPIPKDAEKGHAPVEPRSAAETARTVAAVVLAVLITLFAVFNLNEVKVDWIVGSARAPLIVVVVISLLVGVVLTYFAERRVRRRR